VAVKCIVRRRAADQDVETIIDYYLGEAGSEVALGFVDALEAALLHISRHPGTGSPEYAVELGIPGLRSWSPGRYPHLVFYFDKADEVEVWRVLHDMLDLPRRLRE